ncbi:MAG: toll/interleukin-1 receptor domain-containing protein [Phototrophicaceae bacterium]
MATSDYSDVFVSYRRVDVAFVKPLVEALRAAGKEVWIDWEDIPPGSDSFSDDIKRGLEGADAFIAVLSPDYMQSSYCIDLELGYSVELKKKIVPIVYRKFDDADIPKNISHINWIYFTPHAGHENTFEESIPKVISALDEDSAHAREHRRLMIRALEWQNNNQKRSYLLSGDSLSAAEMWVGQNVNKVPHPTDLHLQYISSSRQIQTAVQRRLLIQALVGIIVSIILAIFAVIFGLRAREQEMVAKSSEQAARSAQEVALDIFVANLDDIATQDFTLAAGLGMNFLQMDNPPPGVLARISDLIYKPDITQRFNAGVNSDYIFDMSISPDGEELLAYGDGMDAPLVLDVATRDDHPLRNAQDIYQFELLNHHRAVGLSGPFNLILFNLSNGEYEFFPPLHNGGIAAFHADASQRHLVSGDAEGKVIVWDISGQEAIAQSDPNFVGITTVTIDNQFNYVASAHENGEIKLWQITEGALIELDSITFPRATFNRMAFAPDDSFLLAANTSGGMVFLDIVDGKLHSNPTINTQIPVIYSLAVSPNGQYAITGGENGDLILWDVASRRAIRTLSGHFDSVADAVFMDDTTLMSVDWSSNVIQWDLEPDTITWRTFLPHRRRITTLIVSEDRSRLISSDAGGKLLVWDTSAFDYVTFQAYGDLVLDAAFVPDQSQILTVTPHGTVNRWDVASHSIIATYENPIPMIENSALSPDGRYLLMTTAQSLYLWPLDQEGVAPILLESLYQPVNDLNRVLTLGFSPDGATAITTLNPSHIKAWDVENRRLLWETQIPESIGYQWTSAMAFNPLGTQLFLGSRNGRLVRLNALTGAYELNYDSSNGWINDIAVSNLHDRFITADYNGKMRLWMIDRDQELVTIEGVTGLATNVLFSARYDTILYGTYDGVLHFRQLSPAIEDVMTWADENIPIETITCDLRRNFEPPYNEGCVVEVSAVQ